MSDRSLECLKEKVCDNADDIAALETKLAGLNRAVYRLPPATGTMNLRRWLENPPAVPHDNVDAIWTGAADPSSGMPQHPNAPSTQTTEPDWVYTGPDNQMEGWGWIEFDQPTWIQDVNGNTGERGEVWIGECCGIPRLLQSTVVNTPSDDRGILDPVLIPAGVHMIYVRQSDFSANQGFQLQSSLDSTTYANVTASTHNMWDDKPEIECQVVPMCDPVPDGWMLFAPKICEPVFSPVASGGLSAEEVLDLVGPHTVDTFASPQTSLLTLESDNNQSEGSWSRAGNVGTSLLYAREDHQHPIIRLPMEPDPVIAVGGTAVLLQDLVLDRQSDEESIWYRHRVRVSQVAGNNWGWLTVPTIAGYQQPIFSEMGAYMPQSSAIQDDDGSFGASERGPLMDYPVHHWSSTNRLYLGLFRRDNDITNLYVNFVVRYTRV